MSMYISLQCVGKCRLWSTYCIPGTSLIVQLVKNLSVMQETLVRLLGWGDPLEMG